MGKGKKRKEELKKEIESLEGSIKDPAILEKFRDRIKVEDRLLNERTNIFILTNSLWLLVVGFIQDLRLPFICVGIIICIFWLVCSTQSMRVITYLTKKYLDKLEEIGYPYIDINQKLIENIVQSALPHFEYRLRPTDIFSIWLPFLLIEGWLLLFFHTVKILKPHWIIISTVVLFLIARLCFPFKTKTKKGEKVPDNIISKTNLTFTNEICHNNTSQ